ncbi:Werner Syndrome-like exonuclease [Chenopodium quinoa]|uniref:3'-5' exonuclease domain-containing protein n=1 Tax=Chenopodium quinoa TaxID=63459 RepID=A0A803LT65_CHEQI|nr:Werner Syndrome-like exonuclease [Chenopodium quinoa]
MAATTAAPPATITIADANPNPNNNLYDVKFNGNHLIKTTVTSDPSLVTSWLAALPAATSAAAPLIIGLDIEWRPNFGRGYDNPVSTIQLCTTTTTTVHGGAGNQSHSYTCLIFQILHCPKPIPKPLYDFLANEKNLFAGVGIRSDVEQLLIDYDLVVKNTVDLGHLAVEKVPGVRKGMGLKELAKILMEVDVQKPKRVTLSRWDTEWLSYPQIQYACIDAFLSFEIARKLLALPQHQH